MKDLFDQDDERELPKEFLWENMEAGILDKMRKIEASEANSRRPFVKNRTYLVDLILVLSLGTFFGLRYEMGTQVRIKDAQEINSEESIGTPNKKEESDNIEYNHSYQLTPVELHADSTIEHNITTVESVSEDSPNTKLNVAPLKVPTNPKHDLTGVAIEESTQGSLENEEEYQVLDNLDNEAPDHHDVTSQVGNVARDAEKDSDTVAVVTSSQNPKAFTDSEEEKASQSHAELNDSNDFVHAVETSKDTILSMSQESESFNNSRKNSIDLKREFGLEIGLCVWDEGSRQSFTEREEYESNLLSYQIQGYNNWSFNNGIFLMAGLQYQQLNSRLDYRATIPDYLLILNDTVIRVERDVTTGQIELIYGDVEQTIEAEREVIHYNTTNLFKLSFGAGKQWNFNAFQTDIYSGLSLNAISYNRGRTVIDNEIIDYQGSSNEVMSNSQYFEVFAGGRMHYFISPRIAVTGGLQFQYSLGNWSNVENGVLHPLSIGLNLGLSYTY